MLTRIGVTGGIGSGKSEVCSILSSLGVTVLSADLIARQLSDSDPDIRKKIISAFGDRSYDANTGILRREYIASIVFDNAGKLRLLNSIVHPPVLDAVDREIRQLEKNGLTGYIVVEAPLMFESRLNKRLDYVLTVAADEPHRIERVRLRSHLTEAQIRSRMESQIPPDEAAAASDFIVHNDASLDELRKKVVFFHTIFSALKPQTAKNHEHTR
ncbi:MAG TPA: dephospho-CoA kinase [Bacteroidota bacterium]|nr:dephospho-CoA kinase [Bacteroidota bacterium]